MFSPGIEAGRNYYQSQASAPPLVKNFHFIMMEIELKEDKPDVSRVRRAIENAVTQFGQGDCGKFTLGIIK